jgi:hypothetical protein
MTRDEYNILFHKVGLNRVAFKAVNDCDDEILTLVNAAVAAEREAIKWNRIHSCHADCQNPACVIVREAVAAEREACAKVAEERLLDKANCTAEQMYEMMKKSIAEAIRARGQQ